MKSLNMASSLCKIHRAKHPLAFAKVAEGSEIYNFCINTLTHFSCKISRKTLSNEAAWNVFVMSRHSVVAALQSARAHRATSATALHARWGGPATAGPSAVLHVTQVDPRPGHASCPHALAGHTAVLPTGPTVPSLPRAPTEVGRRTAAYFHRSLHREAKGARLYKSGNPVRRARPHPATRRAPPAPLLLPEPSSSLSALPSPDNTSSASTMSPSSSSPHVLASPAGLLTGICTPAAATAGQRRASSPEPPRSSTLVQIEA
jgi:hypothetical protein